MYVLTPHSQIVNSISLLSSLFFIIPWTYYGIKNRNLYLKYPYFYALSTFFVHISFTMPYGGTLKWKCHDHWTPKTQQYEKITIECDWS